MHLHWQAQQATCDFCTQLLKIVEKTIALRAIVLIYNTIARDFNIFCIALNNLIDSEFASMVQ